MIFQPGTVPAALRAAGSSLLPCQREDPRLWFSEQPAELELAKEFCQPCPLRAACLAGAAERQERYGVWGGEIFQRGSVIQQKRSRGRPRKTAGGSPPKAAGGSPPKAAGGSPPKTAAGSPPGCRPASHAQDH